VDIHIPHKTFLISIQSRTQGDLRWAIKEEIFHARFLEEELPQEEPKGIP